MQPPYHATQFDCMLLNADRVGHENSDSVVFLLQLFKHLEQECDAETDRLEELAASMSQRTQTGEQTCVEASAGARVQKVKRSLNILERAEIANRYRVPHHIFGAVCGSRGGMDPEFGELEASERKIQNYLKQMETLEVEIASATPNTPEGVMLKLRFLSALYTDGSGFAADVISYVVDQSVSQLEKMLNLTKNHIVG